MEITIISAQGLKKTSTLSITFFSSPKTFYHFNPPIHPSPYTNPSQGGGACTLTRVAREGGVNPAWGEKFDFSKVIDKSFFYNKNSYIYLQLYTNRSLLSPRFLGWCAIPARDIVDGFSQVGTARQLSYRLRKKDGSRGHGFVNVMVKLESSVFEGPKRVLEPDVRRLPEMSYGRVAIGVPVKMSSEVADRRSLVV
ncbi:C2 calcium-dependent membrane-targeting protein [Tanacetum coccineum]